MNLWILTEERPKVEVLELIIKKFLNDKNFCAFVDNIRILPIMKDNKFIFCYEIIGIRSYQISQIFLKIVSGDSSFVDYLIFFQKNEPNSSDTPFYAIEETKTDDGESRNTGVYQRISKFVYINSFYPNTKKIMLYNLRIKQKEKHTQTYIFGTKILSTLGVEILGKKLDDELLKPFKSIKELIDFKNKMKDPPKGNVAIKINVCDSLDMDISYIPHEIRIYTISNKIDQIQKIQVSGRLVKKNSLSHDPNIGALSGICAVLRKLGFDKNIEIISHGLTQNQVENKDNKFTKIANLLNISLQDLKIPQIQKLNEYWYYEKSSEKLATIFIHLVVEHFSQGYGIFENHAGCEKGYFLTDKNEVIPLQKYQNKSAYKQGDKNAILFIPDLILLDTENFEIINIEGKKYENKKQGLEELNNYDFIENEYIKKYYPRYKILRSLVLYGSNQEEIDEVQIGFLLNQKGKIVLGIKAPKIFLQAIKNLFDFWKKL